MSYTVQKQGVSGVTSPISGLYSFASINERIGGLPMAKSVAKLHVPIVIPDRDYTARAVVDWVAFVVKLGRTSHGGYLKRLLEPYGVSRVIPLNVGPGGAATEFR